MYSAFYYLLNCIRAYLMQLYVINLSEFPYYPKRNTCKT